MTGIEEERSPQDDIIRVPRKKLRWQNKEKFVFFYRPIPYSNEQRLKKLLLFIICSFPSHWTEEVHSDTCYSVTHDMQTLHDLLPVFWTGEAQSHTCCSVACDMQPADFTWFVTCVLNRRSTVTHLLLCDMWHVTCRLYMIYHLCVELEKHSHTPVALWHVTGRLHMICHLCVKLEKHSHTPVALWHVRYRPYMISMCWTGEAQSHTCCSVTCDMQTLHDF